jgi:hypothetical protein
MIMENEEIEKIKKALEEHETRIAKLENLLVSEPPTIEKKLSIKEFILSKNPKNDTQKTLAVAYYLEKYEGLPSFNVKDLERGFHEAKEIAPENINYKVIANIQKGFMMESKEKKDNLKAWNLTNSGEKFVESNFEKEK